MKKTLFFLLGALLVTMMPGNTQAQSRVKWSGADAVVVYNAQPVTGVRATYLDNANVIREAVLTYVNEAGESLTQAVDAGVYQVIAAPAAGDTTMLSGIVTSLTIVRRPVQVVNANAVTFKWWDGNENSEVTNPGTIVDMLGDQSVIAGLSHTTYALFNDATEGRNKSVVAYFALSDSANYMLDTNAALISTKGVILKHIALDGTMAENGMAIDQNGYCNAVDIRYWVLCGLPIQYKVTFGEDAIANGFQNIAMTEITNEGELTFSVPAGAQPGTYSAVFSLTNGYETVDFPFTYQVNLSKDMIRAIFTDVISIVDTCNCFAEGSFQWYHNGEYIDGANGPYYQDPSGKLEGTYYCTVTMNGKHVRTCEQGDFNIITPDDNLTALKPALKASPNPAVDRVNISINYTANETHTLRVTNVLGMILVNTTFDGKSTNLDLSSFENGTYTVSVDGMVTRVIKK